MIRTRRWSTVGASIALLLGLATLSLASSALTVRAQNGDAPHPAHIHTGTCAELGDIVAPLADVAEATAGETFGAADAILVKESETTVELSLNDILAAPHAVNIHQSAEAIQIYIACGDIGGRVVGGELLIGLQEIDGSGYNGVAILQTADAGTDVTVYLADNEAAAATEQAADAPDDAAATAPAVAITETADAAPTAEATEEPAAAAPAGEEVAVDIRDFAFSPDPIEIAAGDTITWTNQDEVPHTTTAEDRGVLQSGAISPGASFSQAFPQAGEFGYFCEFHPNMTGTIVVQ
ncbi:MAG: cupredoxin family copper-binding protein [Chloroflexia bacterium]|nr:cupredoxin family copper-binding protein [Chloroflexia bacterium]